MVPFKNLFQKQLISRFATEVMTILTQTTWITMTRKWQGKHLATKIWKYMQEYGFQMLHFQCRSHLDSPTVTSDFSLCQRQLVGTMLLSSLVQHCRVVFHCGLVPVLIICAFAPAVKIRVMMGRWKSEKCLFFLVTTVTRKNRQWQVCTSMWSFILAWCVHIDQPCPFQLPFSRHSSCFSHPNLCYSSLMPTPRAPPSEKRCGEQSRITWAYSPKWKTNEITRSLIT